MNFIVTSSVKFVVLACLLLAGCEDAAVPQKSEVAKQGDNLVNGRLLVREIIAFRKEGAFPEFDALATAFDSNSGSGAGFDTFGIWETKKKLNWLYLPDLGMRRQGKLVVIASPISVEMRRKNDTIVVGRLVFFENQEWDQIPEQEFIELMGIRSIGF